MTAAISEIAVADPSEAWSRVGFTVAGELCQVGSVRLRLVGPGAGRGLVSWVLAGIEPGEFDELRPEPSAAADPLPPVPRHPNGAVAIDHVVAFSPDLDRTVSALERAGLDLRRLREGPTPGGAERQAFFRLGEVVLEVIEAPPGTRMREDPARPARLWGLAFTVADLEETAAALGDLLGDARDAVQPGHRIATLRRDAGLSVPVAFMTPAGPR